MSLEHAPAGTEREEGGRKPCLESAKETGCRTLERAVAQAGCVVALAGCSGARASWATPPSQCSSDPLCVVASTPSSVVVCRARVAARLVQNLAEPGVYLLSTPALCLCPVTESTHSSVNRVCVCLGVRSLRTASEIPDIHPDAKGNYSRKMLAWSA